MAGVIPFEGELAGLATALLWSSSALAWGIAGRRVGALATTTIRLLMAVAILVLAHWILMGEPVPTHLPAWRLWLLALSGLMGVALGDLLLFRGMVLVGPRLAMLIMALSPIASTLAAWLSPAHEPPGGVRAILGIALTVSGVAWVLAEPGARHAWPTTRRGFRAGVLLCLGAVVCGAAGYVISHFAMQPDMSMAAIKADEVHPFDATVIRVLAGTVATLAIVPLLGGVPSTIRGFADRKALWIILGGTIVGPVVGIWMSMIALKLVSAGVAVALINTSPIVMIPLAYLAYGERPSWRALGGTVLAMAGVFLLMVR